MVFPVALLAFAVLFLALAGCSSSIEIPLPQDTTTPPPSQSPQPSLGPTFQPSLTLTAPERSQADNRFGLCSPLADIELEVLSGIISRPFIPPPNDNWEAGHHGVDFFYDDGGGAEPSILGTPIQAILSGQVSAAMTGRLPYGNWVMIETPYQAMSPDLTAFLEMEPGQSLYHLYAHLLEAPDFAIGDEVDCGAELGLVGATGLSSRAHLHLETRIGPAGETFPAMAYYEATATQEEKDAYVGWRKATVFDLMDPMLLFTEIAQPE